jgi:hypothetical protein
MERGLGEDAGSLSFALSLQPIVLKSYTPPQDVALFHLESNTELLSRYIGMASTGNLLKVESYPLISLYLDATMRLKFPTRISIWCAMYISANNIQIDLKFI